MPGQFVQTATRGFGSRILGSLLGIPLGLILFAVGIYILFWNEGRFDLSTLAQKAVEINSDQAAPAEAEGELVAVKGTVATSEKLGDTFLKPQAALALTRKAEMYAWIERKSTQTETKTGGSQVETTTYDYEKTWVSEVTPSESFTYPQDHTNPAMAYDDVEKQALAVTLGRYRLDLANLKLPDSEKVLLSADNIIAAEGFRRVNENYMYKGGPFESPQVGDIRISYTYLPSNFNGVVFGKLSGTNIESYRDAKGNQLFRLFDGNKDEAVATLHNEYKTQKWIFRLIGFLAILFGLLMVLGPITTILSFFPTLGRITGAIIFTIILPISLLISGMTILIGIIAHNTIALIITLGLALAVSAWFIRRRGAKIAKPA